MLVHQSFFCPRLNQRMNFFLFFFWACCFPVAVWLNSKWCAHWCVMYLFVLLTCLFLWLYVFAFSFLESVPNPKNKGTSLKENLQTPLNSKTIFSHVTLGAMTRVQQKQEVTAEQSLYNPCADISTPFYGFT